ncbi:hypothetical protein F4561_005315 [Lipingzhangella halophila]|uniref:Uncharacterized protein n=1 Tax=Lipingzhangella halophila TaxID=1783352 RepID=A0A7W7RM29_9ACTN|nr:DUF416 family protein [Lipingzhangella halophila]MBB4934495.1 hypothetical protein [Lipingzhangella halophila]
MGQPEERQLAARLEALTPVARAVPPAAVATRLLPDYSLLCARTGEGDPVLLEATLDAVWSHLQHGSGIEPSALLACFELGWAPGRLSAAWLDKGPDAVDALTYLGECGMCAVHAVVGAGHVALHGQAHQSVLCLRKGREGTTALVCYLGWNGAPPSRQMAGEPLVRREARLQRLDLRELEASGPAAETLTRIRARARSAAQDRAHQRYRNQ